LILLYFIEYYLFSLQFSLQYYIKKIILQ
jgi:hypothetical protein